MSILLTGGLGYIGSHIAKLYKKDDLIVIDDMSNSNLDYQRIFPKIKVYIEKINKNSLKKIFHENDIKQVIHLAGSKSVSESLANPLKYYKNNFFVSMDLLESMDKYGIKNLIFSSSATVYGDSYHSPLKENLKTNPVNPYGNTKSDIEKLIIDYSLSNMNFSSIILRYFNPIGAHKSGFLSDNPKGEPQNLMPIILEAVNGNELKVYGKNYPTKDGTCIRDYIHVLDLAECHILCLKYLKKNKGYEIFNVGLGRGLSVLNLIKTFETSNKIKLNYKFSKRRKGDVAISFACNKKIKSKLGWNPKYTYKDMCIDSWNTRKSTL